MTHSKHIADTPEQLKTRFQALDNLLYSFQDVWQPEPFQHPNPPWKKNYPVFHQTLLSLTEQDFIALKNSPDQLIAFVDQALNLNNQLVELSAIRSLPSIAYSESIPDRLKAGISGRKWSQLQAFVDHLFVDHLNTDNLKTPNKITDWCCGKGNLARLMAYRFNSEVNGLEYDEQLCEKGNSIAQKLRLPVSIIKYDVLQQDTLQRGTLQRGTLRQDITSGLQTALHACGDLHKQVLRTAVNNNASMVAISPCCYHLTKDSIYQPISALPSKLRLTRTDLKLAVQETVTAPKRDQKQRKKLKQWRLAFDQIQRYCTGIDQYQPCPSTPMSVLQNGFDQFTQTMANHLKLEIPKDLVKADFLQNAETQLECIERLELARHGFRRALELWLVYDRALFLTNHHYQVTVGTFCDRALTPRNLMIQANRP